MSQGEGQGANQQHHEGEVRARVRGADDESAEKAGAPERKEGPPRKPRDDFRDGDALTDQPY